MKKLILFLGLYLFIVNYTFAKPKHPTDSLFSLAWVEENYKKLHLFVINNNIKAVRTLVHQSTYNIRINAKNNEYTVLMRASANGKKECVEALLEHPKIDVNAKNKNKKTALAQASSYGHEKCVEALLKHPKIDVNAIDEVGRKTALHKAAQSGKEKCIEALLKHPDIDVNAKNKYKETALDQASRYASRYRYKKCVELLENAIKNKQTSP